MTVVTLKSYKFKVPLSQTFTLSRQLQTLHAVGQLWIKTNATLAGCSTSPHDLTFVALWHEYAGTLLTYLSRA